MGKTVRKSFNGRNLQQMTRVTKGSCLYKTSDPKLLSAPPAKLYILNLISNATSNTFLNISKPTKCRLIPFKLWLDKCVGHSIFVFERSAWFPAPAFAFCLMAPLSKKSQKEGKNNLFQFCFTLRKCFVFVICGHFMTLKWLNVLKSSWANLL